MRFGRLQISVAVFGFANSGLINSGNRIIVGHRRVEATGLLGMDRVPAIRLDYLSEDQIRADFLADPP